MHLKRAFNPGFFVNQQLAAYLFPLPSTAWNVTSPTGPHLDWTVAANAKKIYDYLGKAGGQVGTFGTNPLWKIADGPFVLSSFSPVTSSWTLKANPHFGGSPKPYVDSVAGRHLHRDHADAQRHADRHARRRFDRLLAAQQPLQPAGSGLHRVRTAGFRLGRGDLQFRGQDRPLRQDRLPVVLSPGAPRCWRTSRQSSRASITTPAGWPTARSRGPEDTVRAEPTAVTRPIRTTRPRRSLSSRRMAGTSSPTAPPPAREPAAAPPTAAPGSLPGTPISFPWYTETAASGPFVSLDRRGDHLRGQAGRGDQHPADPEDVQLHREQLQRP